MSASGEPFAFLKRPAIADAYCCRRNPIGHRYQARIGGQFIGCRVAEFSVQPQHLEAPVHWLEDQSGQQCCYRVQAKFEGCDNAEVPATATHSPEEVRV